MLLARAYCAVVERERVHMIREEDDDQGDDTSAVVPKKFGRRCR